MRRAVLNQPPEPSDDDIVLDMDHTLELVMEVLTIRVKVMSDKFKKLFTEGDDNGDGVLSYTEFRHIVHRAAPSFSARRILRMFREALTSGTESSVSIDKAVFAHVCKAHNMIQLFDRKEEGGEETGQNDGAAASPKKKR